jgi:hypothetical protein
MSILVALCWGLLAGLVVCVPLGYYYRFWRESSALRGNLDYTRASARRDQSGLGFAAARPKAECVPGRDVAGDSSGGERAGGSAASGQRGDRGYRNNSDPRIQDFDWPKARCASRI